MKETMTNHDRFDVVIAGAGFAGLSLALALTAGLGAQARIALVTRDGIAPGQPRPDSRATALSAASVRMLSRLGVWAHCEPSAQAVTGIDITDSSLDAGVRPILLSYDNLVGDAEPASHIVPNAALLAALAAGVAATSQITVIDHANVTGFTTQPGRVRVMLDNGRALDAALLAAADGRNSPVRALSQIKTVGWSYPQTGITVMIGHDRPHQGRAVQHFLPGGPFAILPLRDNRSCVTWSEDAATARRLIALDDPVFTDEIDKRAGGRLGTITLAGPRQSWPLEMFIARAFTGPRLALVGDAAHNVHPIAGQGLNLGLRDVAALAEAVVDTHRLGLDIGAPTTLQRYERWRRFDTMTSAASFDMLNRAFSTEGTLRRSLREFGLGVVNQLPGLKQRLVAEAAGIAGDVPRLLRGEAI
jgi:2-octaprenyl-6-methoxyphenol hydroxylase